MTFRRENEATERAWEVNLQFLVAQMGKRVSRIDLHGETISQVLNGRFRSATAREIRFLQDNAVNYGYIQIENSWVRRQ